MMIDSQRSDRGTSITITHVLTIGISTLLIAVLLTSSGTLLETETERSAESSLETIGERLAGEISDADRMATSGADSVNVTTDHPTTVANSQYTVTLLNETHCGAPLIDNSNDCIRLTATGADTEVYVPIATEIPIEGKEGPVYGGSIDIYASDSGSGEITIKGVN